MELSTATKADQEAISRAFSNRELTWHGVNVFDVYLDTSEFADRFEDMHPDIDSQECYLGWHPKSGSFVAAHDVWYEEADECDVCWGETIEEETGDDCTHCDGNGHIESEASESFEGNIFVFGICPEDEEIEIHQVINCGSRMFYHAGYDTVKEKFPGIIDIRLD